MASDRPRLLPQVLCCGLLALAAAALSGCGAAQATGAMVTSAYHFVVGEPEPPPDQPVNALEGRQLLRKIKADPTRMERLSVREKRFLAAAIRAGKDEDAEN